MENKPKITFAPGCFDHLDVESQEELDEIVADIQRMFEGKTPDEIQAMSRPVDFDELMAEDPEMLAALMEQLGDFDPDDVIMLGGDHRTLQ